MSNLKSWPGLVGRQRECDWLTKLLSIAQGGRSEVLILRGEAGIGKSALLDELVERATGCSVARAVGVESEMELAYAGLQQLCAPFLVHLSVLPTPQKDALGVAFGLKAGPAPDHFLVGLAVLTLLSGVAARRPLVCCVDDAQWLDAASAQALEFVARRLTADPVLMLFAVREASGRPELAGLPELLVGGLNDSDAAVLLESVVSGRIDRHVRDRIVAESRGNPLALLEMPRGLRGAELTFWPENILDRTPLSQRLEEGFLRQIQPLPPDACQLMLTAAAEPIGDLPLLLRAIERLGITPDAMAAAEATGLIELGGRVRFRHPLVRSAVYRAATPAERRQAHRVLADVTDPELDPDRRAWHRARATLGPDEAVAQELERSAGRARSHGGLAATAAFLERAVQLTADPATRVRRCLDAGLAKTRAGEFESALALLEIAERESLSDTERARVEVLRAECAFAVNHGNTVLPLLLAAGRRLESTDPRLARDIYLEALESAVYVGRLAAGTGARQVADAIRAAPPATTPDRRDDLLEGLAVRFTEGYAWAVPLSRRAVQEFASAELTLDEALGPAALAAATASSLWDDDDWDILTCGYLQVARNAGSLHALRLALITRTIVFLFTGDLIAAESLTQETQAITDVIGSTYGSYGEIGVHALRGHPGAAEPLIEQCNSDFRDRDEGFGLTIAHWARAVLHNGLGHYREALGAAQQAASNPLELGPPQWALGELVEAAVRSGKRSIAESGLEQLSAMAQASGTDWALGIESSRRALLFDGGAAEDLYREANERLAHTKLRVEQARAQLLFGEWLRREGRRSEARGELRAAYEALSSMGLDAFAERARRELLATGETVRKRKTEASTQLTSQEGNVARFAAEGLTNSEISATLYISPKTVEWHMRNIFVKLGVGSRAEIRNHLPPTYRMAT
jgi:DNA-binding CsgD family transcriptional regulator